MFQLIQSNAMHRLADAFIDRAGDLEPGPFEAQTVVVQSFGMGQWLKIRQAETLGIAANIDCILPANLIWRLYQALLPDLDLPTESPYSIERLTWHLMKRFPECETDEFDAVRQFLDGPGDPQVRAWQLGEKIATLFDQYLIYRPEWIDGWDHGASEPGGWQRSLWQRVTADPALAGRNHRARLHAALLERLATLETLPPGVPRQISVMGLSTLPPIHLQTLQAIAAHIDVDLYLLNPCEHYWGDIVSTRERARRSIKVALGKESLSDEDYLSVGNPLLSSWGKQGREFLELLLDTEGVTEGDFFEEPEGDSALHGVKRDILGLTFGGEFGEDTRPTPVPVAPVDLSIQVHVCHSRLREVEVLYDQLLRLFDHIPDLTPADVIVMTPDVAAYAPFVEAVFPRQTLPYTIADRSLAEESPVLIALRTLLALPDMRLTSTEIMDLLEVPTIMRKFGLTDSDLQLISRWIRDANIRWELDGASRAARWDVPSAEPNTWRFGLDRLLLGFAMEESDGIVNDTIVPLTIDGQQAEIAGTLCEFIARISEFRSRLASSQTAAAWRNIVLELIEQCFAPDPEEEIELATVRDLLIRLESETTETGFSELLTPRLFRYWLDQQLAVSQQSRGFISGGVTIATMVPMRSIPFRVVCLLGMNDGEYPREDRPPSFDLMRDAHRRGDRSKRNDDRYLFLEALLSAEDAFYVSYQGRSARDNKGRPASILVGELLDYLGQVYAHDFVTEHPLQPFSDDYYRETRPGLVTYRTDWFDALSAPVEPESFAPSPLPDDPELELETVEQLGRFFRHPARAFLGERLGIYLGVEDVELEDVEPFSQDGLERYGLAEELLASLLNGEHAEDVFDVAVARGTLMEGSLGRAAFDRAHARAASVFDALMSTAGDNTEETWQDSLLVGGAPLHGHVSGLFGDTRIEYRPATLHARQVLAAWTAHLFINATRRATTTCLISVRNDSAKIDTLAPVDAGQAESLLTDLAALYHEGMRQPLPLVPETSLAWVSKINKGRQAAVEAAIAKWDNPFNVGCEQNDPAYARLFEFPDGFDDRFDAIARRVFEPLLEYWS